MKRFTWKHALLAFVAYKLFIERKAPVVVYGPEYRPELLGR